MVVFHSISTHSILVKFAFFFSILSTFFHLVLSPIKHRFHFRKQSSKWIHFDKSTLNIVYMAFAFSQVYRNRIQIECLNFVYETVAKMSLKHCKMSIFITLRLLKYYHSMYIYIFWNKLYLIKCASHIVSSALSLCAQSISQQLNCELSAGGADIVRKTIWRWGTIIEIR